MKLLLPALAAGASLAALLGACRPESHVAAWRLSADSAYVLEYDVALEGEAEGFRGRNAYDARARAKMALSAVPDSAGGRFDLTLTADSIEFKADDREGQEGEYMVERLRRYKARLALSTTGKVLSVEEEPDLPPVDFSPLNFGRFLAYGIPAFPQEPVKAGSEWQVDQPLLDKFHPGSRVVKRYKAQGVRQTAEGRLLDCKVEIEAWLEDGLATREPAAAGQPPPDLTGKGETVFNLDRGLPVSSEFKLEGRFRSQVREGASDSARLVDLPLRLGLKVDLRFRGG